MRQSGVEPGLPSMCSTGYTVCLGDLNLCSLALLRLRDASVIRFYRSMKRACQARCVQRGYFVRTVSWSALRERMECVPCAVRSIAGSLTLAGVRPQGSRRVFTSPARKARQCAGGPRAIGACPVSIRQIGYQLGWPNPFVGRFLTSRMRTTHADARIACDLARSVFRIGACLSLVRRRGSPP